MPQAGNVRRRPVQPWPCMHLESLKCLLLYCIMLAWSDRYLLIELDSIWCLYLASFVKPWKELDRNYSRAFRNIWIETCVRKFDAIKEVKLFNSPNLDSSTHSSNKIFTKFELHYFEAHGCGFTETGHEAWRPTSTREQKTSRS